MGIASAERRQHPRVGVDIRSRMRSESTEELTEAMLSNLSIGGCFIRTEMPEPPGAMVMVRFALPGEPGSAAVKAVGRVCWVRGPEEGPSGMGIQFVRVADEDLSRLKHYIVGLVESDPASVLEEPAAA